MPGSNLKSMKYASDTKRGSVGTVVPLTCTPSGPMLTSRFSRSFFALRSWRARSRWIQRALVTRALLLADGDPVEANGAAHVHRVPWYQVKSRFVR